MSKLPRTEKKTNRYRNDSFQKMVEHSPIAIFLTEKGNIVYLNRKAVRMLSDNPDQDCVIDYTGRSLLDFVIDDQQEKVSNMLNHLHQDSTSELADIKIIRGDGHMLDTEVQATAMELEGKTLEYVMLMDLEEFSHRKEFVEYSDRMSVMGELAAGIAHEIRNPLTSLKGFLQLADQGEHKASYTDIMLSEIERINLIVNELLLMSKSKLNFRKVALLPFVQKTITLLNTEAILHNIKIEAEIPPEAHSIMIYCEENKMKQVLINLLKNAIEATPENGQIKVWIEKFDQQVSIKIIDHGCGIPEEHMAKLGKSFFTTKEGGTGLGLNISFNIVRNHNGSLYVDSEEGKGTTVDIQLPID